MRRLCTVRRIDGLSLFFLSVGEEYGDAGSTDDGGKGAVKG